MSDSDEVKVLSNKHWITLGISPLQLLLLVLALPVAIFVFILTTILPDATWGQWWSRLIDYLGHMDWSSVNWTSAAMNSFVVVLFLLQFLYIFRAQKLERMTLSPDGIEYTSPLPSFLKQFNPDWFLPWEQVIKAELQGPSKRLARAEFVQLILSGSTVLRRLAPAMWIDQNNRTREPLRLKLSIAPSTQSQEEIRELLMNSEVIRYFSNVRPDLTIESNSGMGVEASGLEKNPHGRIAMAIIFSLLAYTIIDYLIGPDSYADDPSGLALLFVGTGILAAILSWAWLYKSTLGNMEKTGLPMLIGVVAAFAMIPGALRINSMTGVTDGTAAEYFVTKVSDGVLLKPVAAGYPAIDYFTSNKYWDRYGQDDIYHVNLHRGALGFYQFNSEEIVDEIHRYNSDAR